MISAFHASKVPAGTFTDSSPVTVMVAMPVEFFPAEKDRELEHCPCSPT